MNQNNIIKEAVIDCKLVGIDSNAYALISHWQKCARKQGVSKQDIEGVLEMTQSGNYDNLVGVLVMHCSSKPYALADNEL